MKTTLKNSVLIIDDDKKLVDYISDYLETYDFETWKAHDGLNAIKEVRARNPDIVILDLMLPGTSGIDVCRQVRPKYTGPILMLTGVKDDIDQVAAIEVGVDDYVVKPVQLRVLLARVRMLLRRNNTTDPALPSAASTNETTTPIKSPKELCFGLLRICKNGREAYLDKKPLNLSTSEFDLLWLLASHPEEILSRDILLKTLRGIEYDGIDRSVDSRIVGLRKKTGDNPSRPFRFITVRNKGYMFAPDAWGSK